MNATVAEEQSTLTELVPAFMERFSVPGLSLAIAKDGRIRLAEGYGYADRDAGEKVAPKHRFRIASVSKPITSVAIFKLIEQGKLHLSSRVFGPDAVLGTLYGGPPYARWVDEITIEHLLTHTCGGWHNDDRDPMFQHPRWDHARLIEWTLKEHLLDNQPGTHYAYSNFGFCLLGRVIERVTAKSYADFVRGEVLAPCGVTGMELAGDRREDRKRDEVVYYSDTGDSYAMPVHRMDSHGGWLAAASDLVEFALRVDGFPTVPDILSADSIRSMTSASTVNPAYAKGWSVNPSHNWWHTGGLPGSVTILVRTSGGYCWAALTNTRRPGIDTALDRLMWSIVRTLPA